MCFKKCVPRFHDQDLNTAESVCADRCVGKYIDVCSKSSELRYSLRPECLTTL
jgi:hypothetical protein